MYESFNRLWVLVTCLAVLFPAAAVLYGLQHSGQLSGGAIAPSKLCWLLVVVVFWFVLPIYLLMGRSLGKKVKLVLQLFLVSMVIRAVVELMMMYFTKNWLHAYGIAHNIFSVILCLIGGVTIFRLQRIISLYFFYCSALFIIEIYFAQYLMAVSHGDGSVFFLESAPEHARVLWVTWIAVVSSIVVFLFLVMRQAYGTYGR